MRILSLFDGMACGMLAAMGADIDVERYVAYEIDKYAIQTSTHNFSMIEHKGDVFKADFTEFEGFDLLCGGSPCTYWSIAQKNNRETEASGLGWDLFCQYVRALYEAKPQYFVYENNKSMSKAIRASITETFGFEPICINSALLSAQNRQRLYWVGKRESNGTYSKVDVEQPKDRGILLKDILETGNTWREKSLCIDANYYKGGNMSSPKKQSGQRCMVAESVCVAQRGRYNSAEKVEQHFEARDDGKTNVITTVQKDNMVADPVIFNTPHGYNKGGIKYDKTPTLTANGSWQTNNFVSEPVRVGSLPRPNGELSQSQAFRVYDVDGKSVNINAGGGGAGGKTGLYAVPVACRCRGRKDCNGKGYARYECRADEKANALDTNSTNGSMVAEPVCYAEPCEWDEDGRPTKAISSADGKTYTVYEVKNGIITIKGKEYPIKLSDGFYIIRKLTVRECMRLQTVPEWYEFPVSDTQAYKMLGNGWTVEVIRHLFEAIESVQIRNETTQLCAEVSAYGRTDRMARNA